MQTMKTSMKNPWKDQIFMATNFNSTHEEWMKKPWNNNFHGHDICVNLMGMIFEEIKCMAMNWRNTMAMNKFIAMIFIVMAMINPWKGQIFMAPWIVFWILSIFTAFSWLVDKSSWPWFDCYHGHDKIPNSLTSAMIIIASTNTQLHKLK